MKQNRSKPTQAMPVDGIRIIMVINNLGITEWAKLG